jgi:HEAT repeat protein
LLVVLGFAAVPALAEPTDAVGMVVELIERDDQQLQAIGLDRVRHGVTGAPATLRFAALLSTLPPARQTKLVAALGERGDKAAVPAVTALLSAAEDPAVRAAAVGALGEIGGGMEAAVLVKSLGAGEPERSAARRALTVLRGADAAKQVVDAASSGPAPLRATLVEILVDRRERAAVPAFRKLVSDADGGVRMAAARGLAVLGGPDDLADLTAALLAAAPGGDRDAIERAVVAICTVNRDGPRAAGLFLDRFKHADEATREKLLPALGRIGGPDALAVVDGLVADTASRSFGLRALTRWPDATVAGRLLDLHAKLTDPAEKEQVLGALIRIAPLPDNKLDDRQKLDLLTKTMALCGSNAERARVLERANAIRTFETFRFVLPYLDDPALAESACLSVVELAHHQKLRDAHKAEFMKALDRVIGTSKNTELVERANRYKQGKTWDRAKKG